jgi:two-component system, NarL family, sensor kinase
MNRPNSLQKMDCAPLIGLFSLVLVLEFNTPIEYVFGYLYTGPILLANARLGRLATGRTTLLAVFFTLANLWIPEIKSLEPSAIANRAIAVLSLVVTGFLAERIRRDREALARQQAETKAREQIIDMQEDFASTLTHDLKTPLLGAIETLKAFQEENFGAVSDLQQKVLATMSRSHQNSLQLVETLLDVYRNDRSGLSLKVIPLDLADLVEESLVSLASLARRYQVYLSLDYATSAFHQNLPIVGDPLQLQRVLTNLLINAINHSRRDSRIQIELEAGTSFHTVKIIDNGAGITTTELPRLFERFYQSHSDRQARGTGLGLYLARQIIEAHGGTIQAENRESPRGAIFSFRLPAHPRES